MATITMFKVFGNSVGDIAGAKTFEVLKNTRFAKEEAALQAALDWLQSVDTASRFPRPIMEPSCKWHGHHCPWDIALSNFKCKDNWHAEYRQTKKVVEALKEHGPCRLRVYFEYRIMRRWTETQSVLVDGQEYTRPIDCEQCVVDWTSTDNHGYDLYNEHYLYIGRETFSWIGEHPVLTDA
jgi:hypothetical protein